MFYFSAWATLSLLWSLLREKNQQILKQWFKFPLRQINHNNESTDICKVYNYYPYPWNLVWSIKVDKHFKLCIEGQVNLSNYYISKPPTWKLKIRNLIFTLKLMECTIWPNIAFLNFVLHQNACSVIH